MVFTAIIGMRVFFCTLIHLDTRGSSLCEIFICALY